MDIRILKDTKRGAGVFVYCIVYNEAWFLPHFLDYYRKLGVSYFIFYDDGSTDGTLDLLAEQPDCMILAGPPYEQKENRDWTMYQTDVSNIVPDQFGGPGRWSITVDTDEFLVLPTRFSSLGDLISYLELRQLKLVMAPMVDFYPEQLSGRNYGDLSPFEGTPWFDRDMGFKRMSPIFKPVQAPNGIRVRLLKMLLERHPERFEKIFGSLKYRYARLVKVPLLKTGENIRRVDPHDTNRAPPMGIQVGIAHFKFFPGSDQRVRESLARRIHYLNAVEYEFLNAIFELFPKESLVFDRSVRYESPRDMEKVGLIWAD